MTKADSGLRKELLLKEIAEELGIPEDVVRTVINLYLARRVGEEAIDEDAAIELYGRGKTLEQVALELGCSAAGVSLVLRRRNVARRAGTGTRRPRIDAARAVSLYRQGLTMLEVAGELGCSGAGVYKVLERLGVTTRPRGKLKKQG